MNNFCEIGTVWQVILLVLSLLTVIAFTVASVLSFRHRDNVRKPLLMVLLLLLNAAVYVLMQIDSRITGTEHTMHLPYALLLIVTL